MSKLDPYSSRRLLTAELTARGWRAEPRMVGGRHYMLLSASHGRIWLSPTAMVWYPFVSKLAAHTSLQKDVAYTYAEALGVRVPATLVLPAEPDEVETFRDQHGPVVVKPLDGHGSQGVTLNITDREQASAAIANALAVSDHALMQEQVTGQEVRFTVVGQEIVSVLLRQTPQVVGDGTSTVAELIAAENEQRAALAFDYITYPQLDAALIAADFLTDQRVLADGEVLELSKSTMIRGGASVYNITDSIHDSYKQTALRLARSLESEFLVVDLMIDDPSKPQTEQNYAFIEFNTAPSLKMYYSSRDGKSYDMVKVIADMMDQGK